MNSNTIVTYSFLVFVYESQKKGFNDLSDVFVPLIKRILSKMYLEGYTKGESIGEIKDKFDATYGLNIPFSILRKILEKIENEEKRNGNNHFIIFQRDGFIIDSFTFIDFEDEIEKEERDISVLNDAYFNYLEVEGYSTEQPNLFDFIDNNRVFLSSYFVEKDSATLKSNPESNNNLFIQAKFIDFIHRTALYDTLKKIYLGSIISSYLEVDYQAFKSDVELVLDTNFIIGVINLSSRESFHTCSTLLDIAKKLNYIISILPETIRETQNLLQNHAKNFSKSAFLSLVDGQSIYLSCQRQGLKEVDLERRSNNLKEDLADLGIIEANHNLSKRAKFDSDYEVFKEIRGSEESAMNDTIAILYVKEKRKRNQIKSFSDVNCWFVSDTRNKLFYSGSGAYREIVRAEDLLNILWLSNPKISNTNDVVESSLTRLVSSTLGKVLPKKSSLLSINTNINKYLKKEKVRIKDVVLLASNMAEKANRNLDEYNLLLSDKEEVVLETVRKIANKQEKIEKERKQKINEYLVSVKEGSDVAISEFQQRYENKLTETEERNQKIIINSNTEISTVKKSLLQEKVNNFDKIKIRGERKSKKQANVIYWSVYFLLISVMVVIFMLNDYQFEKSAKIISAMVFILVMLSFPIISYFKKDELKWHKFNDWIYDLLLQNYLKDHDYDKKAHQNLINELESLNQNI